MTAPLIGKGTSKPESPKGYEFPNPLELHTYLPPTRTLLEPGTAKEKDTSDGKINIGAY